jgi:hypothetical protein
LIYVFSKDDRGLGVYATQREAVAACEGIDVEDGNYMFFSSDGRPLQPKFTSSNRRGMFMITSGVYVLESVGQSSAPGLRELLGRVTYVEGCGLSSVEMVMAKINEAEQASVGDVPHGSTRGSAP